MKHIIRTIVNILFGVLLSTAAAFAVKEIPIKISVDGAEPCYEKLMLINKMGYLEAEKVAEIFSMEMLFDKASGKIQLREKGKKSRIQFKLDSDITVMDGIKRKMKKKARSVEGKLVIPLEAVIGRAFEDIVGAQIDWDYSKKTLWVSYSGNISDIRHYSYDRYFRFVIEMTKDMDYKYDESGNMISLFIPKGKPSRPFDTASIKDDAIYAVYMKTVEDGYKISIKKRSAAAKTRLKKLPSPPRIVVDISKNTVAAKKEKKEEQKTITPAGPAKRDKANLKDIKLIVIDPGHGGKDPGAIGPRGTREKDITLAIAKKLAKEIRDRLKIRTLLTRTHDVFVPLAKRTDIANSKNADIFISIHTNASLNPKSSGFEIYFLSTETSDKEAQAVANMENSVMAMEDDSRDMSRVSRILWSLTMNQYMNESSELCGFIIGHMKKDINLPVRGVKQAGFYVMRGARMPSVLVESAFISNKREEKLLTKDEYQEKIARTICDAVKEYQRWLTKK